MHQFLLSVIAHTPSWVWLLLAALVALGLMQARDHSLPRARVLLQPVALGALSLYSAMSALSASSAWPAAGAQVSILAIWWLGAALGLALNRRLMLPRKVSVQANGRFAIGGSWSPLVLLMSIFLMRYVSGASLAIAPQLAGDVGFAITMCLAYGLPSGLLAARAWRILGHARPVASAAPARVSAAR